MKNLTKAERQQRNARRRANRQRMQQKEFEMGEYCANVFEKMELSYGKVVGTEYRKKCNGTDVYTFTEEERTRFKSPKMRDMLFNLINNVIEDDSWHHFKYQLYDGVSEDDAYYLDWYVEVTQNYAKVEWSVTE